MSKSKYIGSDFDDFLAEEGILEETEAKGTRFSNGKGTKEAAHE